jgi:hypothetical protein
VYAIARLIDVVLILIAAGHQFNVPKRGQLRFGSLQLGRTVVSAYRDSWVPDHHPSKPQRTRDTERVGLLPLLSVRRRCALRISGLGLIVVAHILSALLGAAAVTVMFRLLAQNAGRFTASARLLLTCTYMAAPAMQIAYTKNLALLLVCPGCCLCTTAGTAGSSRSS